MGNANLEAGNTEFRASTERGERDEEREVRYRDYRGSRRRDETPWRFPIFQGAHETPMKVLNETTGAAGDLGWRQVRKRRSAIPTGSGPGPKSA